MERKDWVWYLVVTKDGDVEEAFNSEIGAVVWQSNHGGIVVKVKEVQDEKV